MTLLNLLPIAVAAGGLFVLIKLKFFFILHPRRTVRKLRGALSSTEARSTLALALAGTLGVGNIVGVAVGISVGGAGSVFWLLISSVFACALKYAESALGQDMRSKTGGGMMYVIRASFGRLGKPLSFLYASFCFMLAFVMGAALQSSSVVESVSESFSIGRITVGALFFVPVLAVVLNGAESIEKFTAVIIPITTAVYILLCIICLIFNFSKIPSTIILVLDSAFCTRAFSGAAVGTAIREGFSRGLLSNEAGAGTSSLAHSSARADAASSGLLGMCEVFFDTVLLCTLTAFSILVAIPEPSTYTTGMSLVLASVGGVLGSFSRAAVTLCVVAFAFSTVICWYYYGYASMRFLTRKGEYLYLPLFLTAVFSGAFVSDVFLIRISDYLLLALTLLTLSAIIKNSDRLRGLSECSGLIIPRF